MLSLLQVSSSRTEAELLSSMNADYSDLSLSCALAASGHPPVLLQPFWFGTDGTDFSKRIEGLQRHTERLQWLGKPWGRVPGRQVVARRTSDAIIKSK